MYETDGGLNKDLPNRIRDSPFQRPSLYVCIYLPPRRPIMQGYKLNL
jgi:hypothetical protein